jgi:hypothetical protein
VIKLGDELEQLGQGVVLPWTVFDAAGRSLLRKGMIIDSLERLALLTEAGVYRGGEEVARVRTVEDHSRVPFFIIGEWMGRLNIMLHAIAERNPEFNLGLLDELCVAMQVMCAEDADAALAAPTWSARAGMPFVT